MSRAPLRLMAVMTALALVCLVVALVASAGVPPGASGTSPVREVLPDLDQETPSEVRVQRVDSRHGPSYRLGFRSAVRNIGSGPLSVIGERPDRTIPEMQVDQVVQRIGGPPRVIRDVGRMRYVISPDHRHWHYLGFDRYSLQTYELRSAEGGNRLVEDQKTGFCLGDRYRVNARRLAATPPEPVYTSRCGLTQPRRLRVQEGISVGYGDDYSAFLEGQDLPLDGLPSGRYVLVHRVNADHGLRELAYGNNSASLLLKLRWKSGHAHVRVLARCPGTAECERRGMALSRRPGL